jgi:hypothetical protein
MNALMILSNLIGRYLWERLWLVRCRGLGRVLELHFEKWKDSVGFLKFD